VTKPVTTADGTRALILVAIDPVRGLGGATELVFLKRHANDWTRSGYVVLSVS
jgi:hypothetical protein